jgi:hypothetical protein
VLLLEDRELPLVRGVAMMIRTGNVFDHQGSAGFRR